MAKIKVIWKDGSVSYFRGGGRFTPFIEDAKEYKTLLIGARSARILLKDDLVKDVRVIYNNKEYITY